MKYLLDTCTLSYFARGDKQVQRRLTATSPQLVAATVVTEMEVEFGLLLHPERSGRLAPVMRALLNRLRILPLEREDARAAAAVRAGLQKAGTPVGAYDVLIAGTALARGLVVVTGNVGEFSRVGGLVVEDWRSSC